MADIEQYDPSEANRMIGDVSQRRNAQLSEGGGDVSGVPKGIKLFLGQGEFEKRISNTQVVLMVGFALVVDIAQFLLDFVVIGEILNPFIDLGMFLTLWFWFIIKGFSPFSGKNVSRKLATAMVTAIIELIPLINDLPAWTFFAVRMNMIARVEDFENHREKKEQESQEEGQRQNQQEAQLLARQRLENNMLRMNQQDEEVSEAVFNLRVQESAERRLNVLPEQNIQIPDSSPEKNSQNGEMDA